MVRQAPASQFKAYLNRTFRAAKKLGYKTLWCLLWCFGKLLLTDKELHVFEPKTVEREGENDEENEAGNEHRSNNYPDILPNVEIARLMGSFKAWLAFQISWVRNTDITKLNMKSRVSDVRGSDLILRKGSSFSYALPFGQDGFIDGRLEFFMTENGSVFMEKLHKDGTARSISELKIDC